MTGRLTEPSTPLRYATSADGVSIAYIRVGEGPAIVFAANNTDAQAYFYPDLRGATAGLAGLGWEVIRHDVRGAGASDRDVNDLGLDARVNDLEAIVSRVRCERFVLAALDEGCPAAIAYAARHPERVSHLVLLCPWADGAAHFAHPPMRQATLPPATNPPEWKMYTNIIGAVLTEFTDPTRQREIAEAIQRGTSAETFNSACRALEAVDVTPLLSRVSAPTLVLHDPTFAFASFDQSRAVATGIPDARLEVMNESFMMGPRHDLTVAAIDRFLRGSATPESSSPRDLATLTRRERDVLRLIAAGHPNKTIASRLGMSERTVARHITNLYAKIGVQSKAAATAFAIRHGLT
jgi:DNA-binding CsgD family transcriptional regulator/pimeloyl-ACP methyl ester carboxylesterase